MSNFTGHSAPQKNQIEGSYRTRLVIKMRGPDIMRAGNRPGYAESYVERQHKKRQIVIRREHFFTTGTICVMPKPGLGAFNCNQPVMASSGLSAY